MDYPPGFPDDLKPPVESALASEEIAFTQARKEARTWHPDVVETLIKRYIRRVMLVFADSACRAVEKGRWNGDDFRKAFDKYLRSLTQYVWTRKHPRPWDQAAMIDLSRGALTGIEESEEWLAIQDRLRTAARGVNAS
ncbi:MAG TPA: hypothetical protein VK419_13020, partial [Bryobacteraceae bacterium]|nr:hypothetical protein [Bryobacteraceae bacterium]